MISSNEKLQENLAIIIKFKKAEFDETCLALNLYLNNTFFIERALTSPANESITEAVQTIASENGTWSEKCERALEEADAVLRFHTQNAIGLMFLMVCEQMGHCLIRYTIQCVCICFLRVENQNFP